MIPKVIKIYSYIDIRSLQSSLKFSNVDFKTKLRTDKVIDFKKKKKKIFVFPKTLFSLSVPKHLHLSLSEHSSLLVFQCLLFFSW